MQEARDWLTGGFPTGNFNVLQCFKEAFYDEARDWLTGGFPTGNLNALQCFKEAFYDASQSCFYSHRDSFPGSLKQTLFFKGPYIYLFRPVIQEARDWLTGGFPQWQS
ncbi:hypothetical protein CEXT_440971 [Caerostris extrusa]|uniref:Uncharacterized protein n=1 Tax=Caerostris extrusa TaxID=172846 RepID=A0AAV4Y351_CAEEX|nr:hypothetical protein CEXT_440971 [Caerostris extrusa]